MLIVSFLLVVQQGVAGGDSLTLDQALAAARAQRSTVALLSAQVEERRAQRRVASRPSNPTAEFSRVDVEPARRLVINQSLASLVRLPLERSSATHYVDAATADSAQRSVNLERDVARAYFAVVAAERRVAFVRDLAQIADSLSILASRRAVAGDISDLDRAQFALEATRVRLQLSRAEEQLASQRASLARELAMPADAIPPTADRLDAGLEVDALPMMATTAGDTPEVRRARAAARGAEVSERSLRWARLPVPSLFVQRDWGRSADVASSTRLGLAVPIPLFSQGNEQLDVRAAQARAASAQAREVELDIARALSEARTRLEASVMRARLANDSLVPGATRLRVGAVRLYEAGRSTVLQVLESLRAERDAQLWALDETLAYQQARADLAALAGRSSSLSAR
ncbi:MAG: TolC family protein [Gemmatimonadota bacterium]